MNVIIFTNSLHKESLNTTLYRRLSALTARLEPRRRPGHKTEYGDGFGFGRLLPLLSG